MPVDRKPLLGLLPHRSRARATFNDVNVFNAGKHERRRPRAAGFKQRHAVRPQAGAYRVQVDSQFVDAITVAGLNLAAGCEHVAADKQRHAAVAAEAQREVRQARRRLKAYTPETFAGAIQPLFEHESAQLRQTWLPHLG